MEGRMTAGEGAELSKAYPKRASSVNYPPRTVLSAEGSKGQRSGAGAA